MSPEPEPQLQPKSQPRLNLRERAYLAGLVILTAGRVNIDGTYDANKRIFLENKRQRLSGQPQSDNSAFANNRDIR